MSLLAVSGLVKRFGGVVASDSVALEVEEGEVHALIGPNGAGKSTLIHQVSGSLAPDAGSIVFRGKDVTRAPMHERVARGLARSFQVTNVFARLSALDNVALAVQARTGSSFSFGRPAIGETAVFAEAREVLERLDLADRAGVAAGELSHGEQRRLEVGLALATGAKLLLLDEPMAGMDPRESRDLVALIDAIRATTALLLVEHDMDVVFQLADRISVLVYGRIVATGSPDEIRADETVRRAYLGDELA